MNKSALALYGCALILLGVFVKYAPSADWADAQVAAGTIFVGFAGLIALMAAILTDWSVRRH